MLSKVTCVGLSESFSQNEVSLSPFYPAEQGLSLYLVEFFPFPSSPAARISKAGYAEYGMLPVKKIFLCARQHLI